jgi:DNA-binding transcriptional regulator YdaS (Cro superfamily)
MMETQMTAVAALRQNTFKQLLAVQSVNLAQSVISVQQQVQVVALSIQNVVQGNISPRQQLPAQTEFVLHAVLECTHQPLKLLHPTHKPVQLSYKGVVSVHARNALMDTMEQKKEILVVLFIQHVAVVDTKRQLPVSRKIVGAVIV